MKRYEVRDKETVWEGLFLRALRVQYQDSGGTLRHWETVERVNCDGIVAIVPVTHEGDIILIKQFRPTVNNYVVEFPAGLNDKGEGLEDAAARELREETGYESDKLIFLASGPISSGSSSEILTVYLAKDIHFKGVQGRDETEDIEVLHIPLPSLDKELSRLVQEGNFIDLKIYGFVDMAKKYI